MATPIQELITLCRDNAACLATAELNSLATRAQAEYDAILVRLHEHERECPNLTAGASLVAKERLRQIEYESSHGAGPSHLEVGDLAQAGAAYATFAVQQVHENAVPDTRLWGRALYPWSWEYWYPNEDAVANLIRAGGLIVAAIDHLLNRRRNG